MEKKKKIRWTPVQWEKRENFYRKECKIKENNNNNNKVDSWHNRKKARAKRSELKRRRHRFVMRWSRPGVNGNGDGDGRWYVGLLLFNSSLCFSCPLQFNSIRFGSVLGLAWLGLAPFRSVPFKDDDTHFSLTRTHISNYYRYRLNTAIVNDESTKLQIIDANIFQLF